MGQRHASSPSERIQWVAEMIARPGAYGVVAPLSRAGAVSRQTLYTWKAWGIQALEVAFGAPVSALRVARLEERRVLTLLVQGHASERNIQEVLGAEGLKVSGGTIAAIIADAERRALAWFATPRGASSARVLALDEIYGNDRHGAYLSVVDAQGGAVWQSVGPIAVDEESWTLLLWEVQDQGIRWEQTISDGGRAIQGGCTTVDPHGAHARDVWHVLAFWGKVQGRLERRVTELEERREGIARQAARVAAGKPPQGKNRHPDVAAHAQRLAEAERTAQGVGYLGQEMRRLLDVVVRQGGRILSLAERRSEIDTALALLAEVGETAPPEGKGDLIRLQTHLATAVPRLLIFAERLEGVQTTARQILGDEAVDLLGWAWHHRALLGPRVADLLDAIPRSWRDTAARLFAAWENAVRASSLVETWHSILRPHLAVHRTLSPGLLALLAVWHNHRVFARGVHAGTSPLRLSGVPDAPTDWLVALGYPPRDDAPAPKLAPITPQPLVEAA
jgi:hypothetical protein